jgi:hypothetical protein
VVLSALGTAHITKVSILYYNLESSSQREFLREMVKKVVVDQDDIIVRTDLRSPFAYLKCLRDKVEGNLSNVGSQQTKNGTAAVDEQKCSDCTALGGPAEISVEPRFVPITPLRQFLREISFPQKARLSRIAEVT